MPMKRNVRVRVIVRPVPVQRNARGIPGCILGHAFQPPTENVELDPALMELLDPAHCRVRAQSRPAPNDLQPLTRRDCAILPGILRRPDPPDIFEKARIVMHPVALPDRAPAREPPLRGLGAIAIGDVHLCDPSPFKAQLTCSLASCVHPTACSASAPALMRIQGAFICAQRLSCAASTGR